MFHLLFDMQLQIDVPFSDTSHCTMLRLGRGGLHGARDLRRQLRDDERHEARRVQRAGGGGGGGGAHAAQGALAQPCGGDGSGVRHYLDIHCHAV